MDKFLNNVLLIDGSYMIQRAMNSVELRDLQTRSGMASGGFYGFVRMMNKVIRKHIGHYPILLWDQGHSPRRLDLYPNYKRHAERNAAPPIPGSADDQFLIDLRRQRQDVIDYTTALRIPNVRVPGWEGDDLIYLMTKVSNKCIVVSDDKDFIQLASDTVSIDRTMADEFITNQTISDFHKYPQYEYYKALIGDGSDNIPGVGTGLGGKSCEFIAKLMADYVKSSGTDKHDYYKIFEYLGTLKDDPILKSVRGLRNKWDSLIENMEVFAKNMYLMDFSYVEFPDGFQTLIESYIRPTINQAPNVLNAYRYLGKYEIKGIDPSQTMQNLVGSGSILI